MHWELLSEHAGVFFSDLLDEYFVAQDSSATSEKINLIIRSHALHREELDQLVDTSSVLEENVHVPPNYIEDEVIQSSSGSWVVTRQYI
jgi:hypothetical protein